MSHFMLTAGGAEYSLYGASMFANKFDIVAVAHSLAQINRYTGHARRPNSVAEHSLLCADIAERMEQPPPLVLACLLHDGHESAIGDCSSPAKRGVGRAWGDFESVHAIAFRRQFGINAYFAGAARIVNLCDRIALATERRDLMPFDPAVHSPWPVIDTPGQVVQPADWVNLNTLQREQRHWTEWRDLFVERFHALKAQRAAYLTANLKAQMP